MGAAQNEASGMEAWRSRGGDSTLLIVGRTKVMISRGFS